MANTLLIVASLVADGLAAHATADGLGALGRERAALVAAVRAALRRVLAALPDGYAHVGHW